MRIEDMKLGRNDMKEVMTDLVEDLNEEQLKEWIVYLASKAKMSTKKEMLQYWNNTEELNASLEANEIQQIEE